MKKKDVATKGLFQAKVLSNQQIRQCYYRIILEFDPKASELFRNVMPGQFLELDLSCISLPEFSRIPEHLRDVSQRQVLLRRPFSFSDVIVTQDKKGTSVRAEILYCVLGPATVRMMSLKAGDTLNAIGVISKEIDEAKGTQYHNNFVEFVKYYQANWS